VSFSIKVKHALVDMDINAAELARRVGYSSMYIHNLLNGRRRWNEESMQKVCDVLGLEIKVVPKNNTG